MNPEFIEHIEAQLSGLRTSGFFKNERVIAGPQRPEICLQDGRTALNFCANNYLGLADDPRVLAAAREGLAQFGYGVASVRFICGTQAVHKELETAIARFLGAEDAILYGSCFDANGGVFETLLGEDDAVISDALNHASIIDGIRLCKAQRFRYRNGDLADLRAQLEAADAAGARFKLIVTDGVFSMDGHVADLAGVCDLADRHAALVMVDDSHGIGVLGAQGRGSAEHCGVSARIDITSGTLGKALGGASGGFVCGRAPIIELLRQRSRPYLFSNSLAPAIAAASLAVLRLLPGEGAALRERLHANARRFRSGMRAAGFTLPAGEHPIVPVMLGDATVAVSMAQQLLEAQIYVIAFSFPVVPQGTARIRVQMSAAHTAAHIDRAVAAFAEIGRALGVAHGH